ncbi:MAG: cell division topological specificity factor MinE [Pseudomonadota bacterium]
MRVLEFFRSKPDSTATVAKERLQIIVAHQRSNRGSSALDALLPKMQRDLLEVVRKYVEIDNEQVKMRVEKEGNCEVLEVNITLPEGSVNKNE